MSRLESPALNVPAMTRVAMIERLGVVVALSAAVLKALIAITTFPGWDLDPFALPSPESGLGPSGAMWCDLAMLIGSGAMLTGAVLQGRRVSLVAGVLLALGAGAIAWHAKSAEASIADRWIGSGWLAAMSLAFALSHSRDPMRMRGLVTAVFLGVVTLLCVRAAEQVFIEHPATLADFKRNREAIFAAQGWSSDSAMAKAYERRLSQPEATGWFGLANVYATFAAAGTVLSVFLLWGARQARQSSAYAGPAIALVAGAAGTYFAGGKGGPVAIALGLAVGAAFVLLTRGVPENRHKGRSSLLGGLVSTGALAAVFALVIARGVVGDRLGELSILFRWFYLQATARIATEHPLVGVGPDGFQQAYMLAKNPLSPEDVTSAHNMLADWSATLGVFGIAWCVLWILWIWRAGRSVTSTLPLEPTPAPGTESDRADRWTIAAIGAIPTIIAMRLDQEILTPELAGARIIGLIGCCIVGWLVLRAWEVLGARFKVLALVAGATAAAAHALIDVTGVWPGSAALLAMLIGAAACTVPTPVIADVAPRSSRTRLRAVPVALLGAAFAWIIWPHTVQRWERGLRSASILAKEVGYVTQHWAQLTPALRANAPGAIDEARQIAADVGARVGRQPRNPVETEDAIREFELRAMREVARQMAELAQEFPREWKIRREASRVKLRESALQDALGRVTEASKARLEALAMAQSAPGSQAPSGLAWEALVREACAQGTPDEVEHLRGAAKVLEQAAALAPYDLEYAKRLMALYDRIGDIRSSSGWAKTVLRLDEQLKYDREVKGLSQAEREEAKRLAERS